MAAVLLVLAGITSALSTSYYSTLSEAAGTGPIPMDHVTDLAGEKVSPAGLIDGKGNGKPSNGNSRSPSSGNTTDTTPPSVAITSPAAGATLQPGNLIVLGTSSDGLKGSGVGTIEVHLDGGSFITATSGSSGDWSNWSTSLGTLTEGKHTIYARATDKAGNSKETSVSVTVAAIITDTTAPTVTASPVGGTYVSSVTVTLTASEVATIYYTTNGETPTSSSQVYSSPISIFYTTTLKYFASDLARNSGSVATQAYTIAQVFPVAPSWKGLHGVNFVDPVLRTSGSMHLGTNPAFVDTMVKASVDANFNVFRVPVRWNAYVGNEANFLSQLDLVAKKANDNGIMVWVDFHHFDTTSHWKFYENGVLKGAGSGFPEFVVKCYVVDPNKSYERDPAVLQFWDDYYANKVKNSFNNCQGTRDIWADQAAFMKMMIQKIDHYPNVLGYEILNEPHVWRDSHYYGLGNLHTVIGGELREATGKTIIFTRETAHGYNTADGSMYTRKVSLEDKILPRITGDIRYIPHTYNAKEIELTVSKWESFQQEWLSTFDLAHPSGYQIPLGVGEWATQPPQLPAGSAVTQENMDSFVSIWAREDAASPDGFPVTYWAFGNCCAGEGNALVNSDGTLTEAGRYYKTAIAKYYS